METLPGRLVFFKMGSSLSRLTATDASPSIATPCLVRFCCHLKYDPQATCSRWESFITEVLPDSDCQRLIQEIFGYCLTYDLSQQKFFLFLGDGGNGKGVITRTLRTLLGEDNVSTVR